MLMKTFIGIDLGGTVVKIGLVVDGRVLSDTRLKADSKAGLRNMLPDLEGAIDGMLDSSAGEGALSGIAMAFAGIVDFQAGRALSTNAKYDDAPQVDVGGWVRDRYGVPFVMDNDARMALIGEWIHGAGKGSRNMVMMTIGTGIGTGAVVDSRPLYGRNFCAGSLGGHFTIDYKGRRCNCGNIGCVESASSSFFLPEIIGEDSSLSPDFRADKANCDFKTLFAKYRIGDPDAVAVVNGCMDVWAAGIVNYIHAYDPETVVVGGGVMKSADIILPYLRQKVASLAWCPRGPVSIVAGELGDHAALLASDYYFKDDPK